VEATEEPQSEVKGRLPRFVDVFLYPVSLHGIIYIGIFLFLAFLAGLLNRFILPYAGHYGGILSLLIYILLVGYISYYFAYCIFDSSKGGGRAPNISMQHTPDKEDLVLQVLCIVGCIAVCFCPAAIYYIFTRRSDSIFWVLIAGGSFLFPMALLAGILFDSLNALNPILVIGSILRTFLPYCGLILSFCVLGGLVALIYLVIRRLPVLGFISKAANFYLLLVAAHILGSFYWRNKDRLGWGI
jgi:hypothetical protein